MKIAIHHTDSYGFFSERWINYCINNNIEYKLVCAYDSNIVEQLKDCDAFMWHHSNYNFTDTLFAKQLVASLETRGMKVFPNNNTTWHFDDKVGETYLLQAIDASLVPSYIFYSKSKALEWAKNTNFPKVFKLRGGSGSGNVRLVKSYFQAKKLINRAFGRGFSQFNGWQKLTLRFKEFLNGKESLFGVCKGIVRLFIGDEYSRLQHREKGYVYFQDFIPNNTFDIRICVVDNKAFALKRMCRENDFRASGGGRIIYDKNQIDERCVKIAFDVNDKLKTQSIAFDFVFDENNNPLIVEISYGYSANAYDACEGYWTKDMQWHAGNNFDFCGWMVESLISK